MSEVTSIAPEQEPMTMEQAFMRSQEGFNADTVRLYAGEAPMRELFNRVEEIKESMQRKIDQNVGECVFPTTFYFDTTADKVQEFFNDKGFECEIINVEGAVTVTVRW